MLSGSTTSHIEYEIYVALVVFVSLSRTLHFFFSHMFNLYRTIKKFVRFAQFCLNELYIYSYIQYYIEAHDQPWSHIGGHISSIYESDASHVVVENQV